MGKEMERKTGFEPATPSLARTYALALCFQVWGGGQNTSSYRVVKTVVISYTSRSVGCRSGVRGARSNAQLGETLMSAIRHKVFVSYHHDDQTAVDTFIRTFDEERDVFITRGLGVEMDPTIIDSDNTAYVMQRIRTLYLKDSTVTIVLMGKCTYARRFVDWEIQASLRHGETVTPNGLLGVKLPSYRSPFPNRLNLNLKGAGEEGDCYARRLDYPSRRDVLANAIEEAFRARTSKADLIVNPRERFANNRSCS